MLRRDKWWHREIERIRREHAAERAELIAAVAHLAGKPLPTRTEPQPQPERAPASWTASPEQHPL